MLREQLTIEQSVVIVRQKSAEVSRRHNRWPLATEGLNKSRKVIVGEVVSDGIC